MEENNNLLDVSGRIGGYIKAVCNDAVTLTKQDWDKLFLVCGLNRTGKTVFSMLIGYYMDHNLTIDRIAYSGSQFIEIFNSDLPKGSVIIWDEGDNVSEHWASEMIRVLKRVFKRGAYKNYIVILITPTFFDMNKYWCVNRSDCLFEVYAEPTKDKDGKIQSNRGRVKYFDREGKRILYFQGYKTWNMNAIQATKFDRFSKLPENFPITELELQQKKEASLLEDEKKDEELKMTKSIEKRQQAIQRLDIWFNTRGIKYTNSDLGFIFGCDQRSISRDREEIRQKVKLNGLYARDIADAVAEVVSDSG